MIALIRRHPLATVLIVALVLRVIAVIFSKGFMASDDQYETVDVAYNWLRHGLWSPDGLLTWGGTVTRDIARFPLYALSLFAIMKGMLLAGVDDLDSIMYAVRAVHALLSLITVYASFQIVRLHTRSEKWAAIAGLTVAAHAAMPFLSVRTLIEVVSGHFWILAILVLYHYRRSHNTGLPLYAGLLAGLAWMVRFELAFAILPVPFLLWHEEHSIRPALLFSGGVAVMLLFSGVADWFLLGSFAGSTINHVRQVLTEPPPYTTSPFIYLGVLAIFFLPPLSFVLSAVSCVRSFWRQHKLLVGSTLSFIIFHTLSASRQERYLLPVAPEVFVIFLLALYHQFSNRRFWFRHRRAFWSLAIPSIGISFALLPVLTLSYPHRGVVEPLVQIEKSRQEGGIIWIAPEVGGIFPHYYAGFEERRREHVYRWSDLQRLAPTRDRYNWRFFVLYPPSHSDLDKYIDSVQAWFGPVEPLTRVGPSLLDRLLHELNPDHNRTNDSWVFYRGSGAER